MNTRVLTHSVFLLSGVIFAHHRQISRTNFSGWKLACSITSNMTIKVLWRHHFTKDTEPASGLD